MKTQKIEFEIPEGYRAEKVARCPERGDLYLGANNTVLLAKTNWENVKVIILHKIKPKDKKWIEATPENVKKLGYEWGDYVPCRVRNSDSESWNKDSLMNMGGSIFFPFETLEDFWMQCQLRNKKKGEV